MYLVDQISFTLIIVIFANWTIFMYVDAICYVFIIYSFDFNQTYRIVLLQRCMIIIMFMCTYLIPVASVVFGTEFIIALLRVIVCVSVT